MDHLGDEFQFRIITRDRDLGDTQPYSGIEPGKWIEVGKAQAYYLSPGQQNLWAIARLLRETPHDTVYLNCLVDWRFCTLPLLASRFRLTAKTRTVVAPRGVLSPQELSTKALKKRVFLAASNAINLHDNITWHAATDYEADCVRTTLGAVAKDIRIAPDLPRRLSPHPSPFVKERGQPMRIVFMSRIAPNKNLLFALDVLAEARTPIDFVIRGPIQDARYWADCQAKIKTLPDHVSASYGGLVEPDEIASVLAGFELMFLPTFGESYGHAIAEALQVGVPVLISDRTPWRGLQESGVGFDIPLGNKSDFVDAVKMMGGIEVGALERMRANCVDYANRMIDFRQTAKKSADLFIDA